MMDFGLHGDRAVWLIFTPQLRSFHIIRWPCLGPTADDNQIAQEFSGIERILPWYKGGLLWQSLVVMMTMHSNNEVWVAADLSFPYWAQGISAYSCFEQNAMPYVSTTPQPWSLCNNLLTTWLPCNPLCKTCRKALLPLELNVHT